MTGKPERLTSKYDKISYGDIEKKCYEEHSVVLHVPK